MCHIHFAGGSVIKCVFVAKEDKQEAEISTTKSETGKLRLVSYAREEMHEFIQMLKERCYIRRKSDEDRPVMYTTGKYNGPYELL